MIALEVIRLLRDGADVVLVEQMDRRLVVEAGDVLVFGSVPSVGDSPSVLNP